MNLTMAMPSRTSPRGGAFDKGNMTMRSPDQSTIYNQDTLAKEFAMLRNSSNLPLDALNNTVDIVGDIHYQT